MTPLRRLILLPFLILAGCSTTERAALHVDIADIAITDAKVGDLEAVFTLQIANPALFPIVVESDVHRIHVDGTFLCEATAERTYALPQLGVATHEVRVPLTDGATGDRIREILRRGGGSYRIESRLRTNSGGYYQTVVSTSSGTFQVPGK